jgi:hypothetical protein
LTSAQLGSIQGNEPQMAGARSAEISVASLLAELEELEPTQRGRSRDRREGQDQRDY